MRSAAVGVTLSGELPVSTTHRTSAHRLIWRKPQDRPPVFGGRLALGREGIEPLKRSFEYLRSPAPFELAQRLDREQARAQIFPGLLPAIARDALWLALLFPVDRDSWVVGFSRVCVRQTIEAERDVARDCHVARAHQLQLAQQLVTRDRKAVLLVAGAPSANRALPPDWPLERVGLGLVSHRPPRNRSASPTRTHVGRRSDSQTRTEPQSGHQRSMISP